MAVITDLTLSLEQLEKLDWGEPDASDTMMVKCLHALRKKPLSSLSDGEVRLAVSQRVGAPFILDCALLRLEGDPLLDTDCYAGDLLSALIRAKDEFWVERSHLRGALEAHYAYAMAQPLEVTESFRESLGLPVTDRAPN